MKSDNQASEDVIEAPSKSGDGLGASTVRLVRSFPRFVIFLCGWMILWGTLCICENGLTATSAAQFVIVPILTGMVIWPLMVWLDRDDKPNTQVTCPDETPSL